MIEPDKDKLSKHNSQHQKRKRNQGGLPDYGGTAVKKGLHENAEQIDEDKVGDGCTAYGGLIKIGSRIIDHQGGTGHTDAGGEKSGTDPHQEFFGVAFFKADFSSQ